MAKSKRKTAGELILKASKDTTKYDPLELGYAITDDTIEQLRICASNHDKLELFKASEQYCLVRLVCSYQNKDLKNVKNIKYYAFPFLPQPRPQQAVFLYNRKTQDIKRLWSLPNAHVMATISCMSTVAPQWKMTKFWCDAFYELDFWERIRKQHNILMLSEKEWLDAHGDKFREPGLQKVEPLSADTFDFSKVTSKKIIDSEAAVVD